MMILDVVIVSRHTMNEMLLPIDILRYTMESMGTLLYGGNLTVVLFVVEVLMTTNLRISKIFAVVVLVFST